MKFLRAANGCYRDDRICNADVISELQIFSIKDKIVDYRQKWKNHLEQMPSNRLLKILIDYKPRGNREPGRPQTRW